MEEKQGVNKVLSSQEFIQNYCGANEIVKENNVSIQTFQDIYEFYTHSPVKHGLFFSKKEGILKAIKEKKNNELDDLARRDAWPILSSARERLKSLMGENKYINECMTEINDTIFYSSQPSYERLIYNAMLADHIVEAIQTRDVKKLAELSTLVNLYDPIGADVLRMLAFFLVMTAILGVACSLFAAGIAPTTSIILIKSFAAKFVTALPGGMLGGLPSAFVSTMPFILLKMINAPSPLDKLKEEFEKETYIPMQPF